MKEKITHKIQYFLCKTFTQNGKIKNRKIRDLKSTIHYMREKVHNVTLYVL